MARLLVAILACSLGCCSSSSCSSSGSALDQSCQTRDESLHLLQLKAKSIEATQGQTTPLAIITAYNDSQCTYETGAMMNVSLTPDACFLGWTFNCTCVGDSKALIGKHYESLVCQSGPSVDHIIPVGTCVDGNTTTESSDVFEIADDLGSCPCCGASCADSSALEVAAKESRPKASKLSKPWERKGDNGKDEIEAKMFRGKQCKGDGPLDIVKLKAKILPFIKEKGSSTKKELMKKKLITLGYEFICGCKGRKKLLDVLRNKLMKYKKYKKKQEEEKNEKEQEEKYKKKHEEKNREKNRKMRLMDEADEMKHKKLVSLFDGECFDFDGGYSMITDLLNCPPCEPGTCTVCGDPHVTVFDDAEVALLGTGVGMKRESSRRTEDVNDEFGWGDFWLVKSNEVSMQARYRKVYYPKANQPLNNTYLTAMAVGGPFMRGHRLIVEPRIGSVAWVHPDGSSMELFPSDETSDNDEDKEQFIFEHGDLIKANYSKRTAIVANHGIVQGLDVELPSGVTLVIDRFGKHLDLRIEMAASAGGEGGIDGQCGNFNGDATDDTTELLEQRIGYQVPTDELLFI